MTEAMYELTRTTVRTVQSLRRCLLDLLFMLPTSFFALLLIFLLSYNAFYIFSLSLPKEPIQRLSSAAPYSSPSSSPSRSHSPPKISSTVMYAVREDTPPSVSKTHMTLSQKDETPTTPTVNSSLVLRPNPLRARGRARKRKNKSKPLHFGGQSRGFSEKVNDFFGNPNSTCDVKFFMTWINSLESFGDRESFTLESLFNSHPDGCLVIVSSSLDSVEGSEILRPFSERGHRVMAISPNFAYLFRDTHAQLWFDKLRKGNVDPGEVSLGQNLSNLLRLALLYKFGGVYLDTDVIVLKSFSKLSNVIGAQTVDLETGRWSRLNNAVLIFDKHHPLLFKFIEEFALTFDGNKWGHNGPYLVSRVVSRVTGRPGYDFTVLPPSAFYPVDWSRVHGFFRGPRGTLHSLWLHKKLSRVVKQSYAVHLWNKQSRKLMVERGSIVDHIMSGYCIFCNKTRSYSSL